MKARLILACTLLLVAKQSQAQTSVSAGEVSRARTGAADTARLATRIPGVEAELRARVRVGGDSAQRIAMSDFDWRGRVISVEFDEEDARLFWDVKIVPDTSRQTIVRYRVDAGSGGILAIREFGGIRGLAASLAKRP
jgi:uncharacterized membrane protein YkoI